MNIEITKEDVEYLILLLEKEHNAALIEQHHTDHREYKQIVKARVEKIEELLSMLEKAKS